MNIGLYFGSFNPIHVGHLIIAQYMIQRDDIDAVWFVVSPQNPFKNKSTLLQDYHRLVWFELPRKTSRSSKQKTLNLASRNRVIRLIP